MFVGQDPARHHFHMAVILVSVCRKSGKGNLWMLACRINYLSCFFSVIVYPKSQPSDYQRISQPISFSLEGNVTVLVREISVF